MEKHTIELIYAKSADLPSAMQEESSRSLPRNRSDAASIVDLTRDQDNENEEDEEVMIVNVLNTRNPHRYPPPPLISPVPPLQPIDDERQWWKIAPKTFPPSDRCATCVKAKKWCDLGEKGAYPCSCCEERGMRCNNGPPRNNYHITEWNRPGAAAERAVAGAAAAAARLQGDVMFLLPLTSTEDQVSTAEMDGNWDLQQAQPGEPSSVRLSELLTTSSIPTHSHQSGPIALQHHRSLPGFSTMAPSMPPQYPQVGPPGPYYSPYEPATTSTQPATGVNTDRRDEQLQDDHISTSSLPRRQVPKDQGLKKGPFVATSTPGPGPGPFAPSILSADPRLGAAPRSEIVPFVVPTGARPWRDIVKDYQEAEVQDKTNMGKVKGRGSKENLKATTAIKSVKETKTSLPKKARVKQPVIIISDDDDDDDDDEYKGNGVEDKDEEDDGLDYPPRGNRASARAASMNPARALRPTRSASSIPSLSGTQKLANSFLQSPGKSTNPGLCRSGSQQLPHPPSQSGILNTPGLPPAGIFRFNSKGESRVTAIIPPRPVGPLPYFTRPIEEIRATYQRAYDALDKHIHDLEELSYDRVSNRIWGLQRAEMKGRRSGMRFMIKELKKIAKEYPLHSSDPNDPHKNNPINILLDNHMGHWYYTADTAGIVDGLKLRINGLRVEKIPLDAVIALADAGERTEFDGRRFKVQRAELMARITAKEYMVRNMDIIVVWEQREKEKKGCRVEIERTHHEGELEE